jgi:hypothetical protein
MKRRFTIILSHTTPWDGYTGVSTGPKEPGSLRRVTLSTLAFNGLNLDT